MATSSLLTPRETLCRSLFCGSSELTPAPDCCSYYGSYKDARNTHCYAVIARVCCFLFSCFFLRSKDHDPTCAKIGKTCCFPCACIICILTAGQCCNPCFLPFYRNSCQSCQCCESAPLSAKEIERVFGIDLKVTESPIALK